MREQSKTGKQSKGVPHCDEVHSPAQICEVWSRTRPRIFYLGEWEEARGVLRNINLEDGSLEFEGFIVRMLPRLLSPLSWLHTMIGKKVGIIRTDSMIHPLLVRVIQSGSQECLSDGMCYMDHIATSDASKPSM